MMDGFPKRLPLFAEIHELVHSVWEGSASDQQELRLEQLVVDDAQARQMYLAYVDDTVRLQGTRHNAAAQLPDQANVGRQQPSPSSSIPARPARWRRFSRPAIALSVAGIVLLSVGLAFLAGRTSASRLAPQRVAKIVQTIDAVWTQNGNSLPLTADDWLLTGRYFLKEGIARIVFPWGTEVTLEAPTEIEFSPDGYRQLLSGQLIAKVSPDDTGFTIETPSVKVVDLGTEFGLSAGPNGESEVHVFKGAVDARPRFINEAGVTGSITLSTGEATSFLLEKSPVRQIAFNPKRFSKAWKLTSRVAETTGAMRFVHPPPSSVVEGQTESNDSLLLFLEQEGAKLPAPIPVTLTQPGLQTAFDERTGWLPAGVEIDSYLVHFDPVGSDQYRAAATAEGTVTFDRPILGVIARGDDLAACDSELGFSGTQYTPPTRYYVSPHPNMKRLPNTVGYLISPHPARAIRGLTGLWPMWASERPPPNDWARLSGDRRTLTVNFSAGGEANQLRILVASREEGFLVPGTAPVRTPQPYRGKPFQAGERIEAEDFDLGGDGVGYYDLTPDSLANVYRPNESVEMIGYVLGERAEYVTSMSQTGEWLAYTIDVDEPGTYVIKARVSSYYEGSQIRFEFGDTACTESLRIPQVLVYRTGEFPVDHFRTIESSPVRLNAGQQTMRVVMERHHQQHRIGDFDWFYVERVDEPRRQSVPASAASGAH